MFVIKQGPMPEDHYLLISNELARSSEVSLQAKGVYLFLRSHREGWQMSGERIAEEVGVSRRTINRYLRELETAGYLVRKQSRDGSRFGKSEYLLLASPLGKNFPTEGIPVGQNTVGQNVDHGEMSPYKKTNSFKKTRDSKKTIRSSVPDDPRFASFWKEYPRKVAKQKALEAFREQVADNDPGDILKAVANFRKDAERLHTEKRYIPHPATWLNQERWRDYMDYEPRLTRAEKDKQFLEMLRDA